MKRLLGLLLAALSIGFFVGCSEDVVAGSTSKGSDTISVTLNANKSSYTAGETITLTATTEAKDAEYAWREGGSASDTTGFSSFSSANTKTYTASSSKSYYVCVKSGSKTKISSKAVTVSTPTMTVSVSTNKTWVKPDEEFTLTASSSKSGVTYFWREGGSASDTTSGWTEGSSTKSYTKTSESTPTFYVMAKYSGYKSVVSSVVITVSNEEAPAWPIHTNIIASLFWVGEGASDDNGDISNYGSAWRSSWTIDYGLEDKPSLVRDANGFPTSSSYKNTENPYYFALPYNDLGSLVSDGDGNEVFDNSLTNDKTKYGYKTNRKTVVYWNADSILMSSNSSKSMVKNRWIKITANGNTAYAQWEDAGPFYYNDINYVFGTSVPLNQNRLGAGIDLSPAVMKKLFGEANKGKATVSWQFVNESEVPADPWKKVVTNVQCAWN